MASWNSFHFLSKKPTRSAMTISLSLTTSPSMTDVLSSSTILALIKTAEEMPLKKVDILRVAVCVQRDDECDWDPFISALPSFAIMG
mmetsp:Transcript_41486/g.75864  ORF Transcript_41486/g.75864 Transcript_41486/m.75864 type:complete len:87 (-) Transcript_41486:381-641(-)